MSGHLDDVEPDFNDGEFRIGAKVIEMCDRVLTASRIVPGAKASWRLSIDDVNYNVYVEVAPALEGER